MRVGVRRCRHTQLRRAVAESELALRRAQQNHGAWQQKLLGRRFNSALERDPIEWLERVFLGCAGRPGGQKLPVERQRNWSNGENSTTCRALHGALRL
jgi:hypothetical protein